MPFIFWLISFYLSFILKYIVETIYFNTADLNKCIFVFKCDNQIDEIDKMKEKKNRRN